MDEYGVHVYMTNIEDIHDCPTPTTLTEFLNFLVLANFYQKFMLGFYTIVWSLSHVTKRGSKANLFLSKPQKKSFEEMKYHLCSTPILTLTNM